MSNDLGPELDLYATEDADHEFNQEVHSVDYLDMYEDPNLKQEVDDNVIQSTGNQLNSLSGLPNSSGINSRQRTPGLYVGNLTWWTTDQDVIDALNSIGVTDIHEVKFFENRANGQSKGFCVVTFNSDASLSTVMEKLPKLELQGQNPVVTTCNRQNMNLFESQIRKTTGPQNNNGSNSLQQPGGIMGISSISGIHGGGGGSIPQSNMGYHQGGNSMMGGSNYNRGYQPHTRPPLRMPLMSRPGLRPNGPMMGGHPRMRTPYNQQNPQQQWSNMRPGLFNPPPSRLQANNLPPRLPIGMSGAHQNSAPVMGLGPAPHVNPAFFPSSHPGSTQNSDMYNRSATSSSGAGLNYTDYRSNTMGDNMLSINDAEMEEIMTKNRSVMNLATNHALADAAAGNYQTAMDTLVTAMTLIKQSKGASDERCKIFISTLQDTLHGIEAKYYGRSEKTSLRPRSRSRERDRERDHRDSREVTRESRDLREHRDARDSREDKRSSRDDREKSSRREKSHRRSRSREHKERSKDRERYHDDRHRDREKSDRHKRS